MRAISFSILLCVSMCLSAVNICTANETYWISFNGRPDPDAENPPCCSKYLMKIDALGNVLRPPVKVIRSLGPVFKPLSAANTITNNGTRWINMWLPANRSFEDFQFAVYRAVIEKTSMRVVSLHRSQFRMNGQFVLQASQKEQNNFLILSVTEHEISSAFSTIKGFAISESGLALGPNWPLIAENQNFSSAGVSSDGRILFYTLTVQRTFTRDRLIFQSLGGRGLPIGKPVTIEELRELVPHDVTSILPGHKRYALFTGGGANADTNLWLQVIDANTLQKVGSRIMIARGGPSAVVDPLGRFVVYGGLDLFFQALDAIGRPSGTPKFIATGLEDGIDILME